MKKKRSAEEIINELDDLTTKAYEEWEQTGKFSFEIPRKLANEAGELVFVGTKNGVPIFRKRRGKK